eukprot:1159116-Pelagomonas_calceolata.AAC.10
MPGGWDGQDIAQLASELAKDGSSRKHSHKDHTHTLLPPGITLLLREYSVSHHIKPMTLSPNSICSTSPSPASSQSCSGI